MFGLLDIPASGLAAQRTRLEVTTANIVNANTILDAKGHYSPFRRRIAMLSAGDPTSGGNGVHVSSIQLDQTPFKKKWEPESPYADADGNVNYPNVDPEMEMVNALDASRAYE